MEMTYPNHKSYHSLLRVAAASDKVYQLLTHDRLFSLGTPASSTTKTSRHDIAEILLKVALNTKNQSINLKPSKICDLKEINNFLKDHLMIISV
jgi:hypothetical protein